MCRALAVNRGEYEGAAYWFADEGDTTAQLAAACAGLWELGHEQLNGAVVHLAPS